MNCVKCGNQIPEERIAILPNTKVCVSCSTEKPKKGFMSFEHKTAPTITFVEADDTRSLRAYSSKKKLL